MHLSASFFRRFRAARWGAIGVVSFIIVITVLTSGAAPVATPYEIGTWEGFRPAAISYTFDDDLPNQYAKAVPMFDAKGFKLTLFTVVNWVPGKDWAPLKAAAAGGHEIASHTVSHPNFSQLSDEQQTNELKNSQTIINENVPGQRCVTLAYPFCVEGNEAITGQFYIAARGCSGQLVPSTPPNFLNISSFVCGSLGSIRTPQDFNKLADRAAAAKSWSVLLIHAIDDDKGYSPLSSATLQSSVDYLSANPDKFWVETFGHVVCYIRERNAATVTEVSNTGNAIIVRVSDNLDASIYNVPITLRRPMPANWQGANVTQSNKSVAAHVLNVGSTNFLMFDVVPDGGDVLLAKTP